MNTRTTLIVAVIALLLGAYFIVFETDLFDRQLATTREREQEIAKQPPGAGELLFADGTIAPEKVQTVRVQVGSEPPVVFVKQADAQGWVQIEPVRFDVQDHRVTDAIEAAAGLRQTAKVNVGSGKSAIAPADIGMNPPRAVVTISGPETQERTFVLGTRPGAGRAYLATGDPAKVGSAYIVGERLHDAVLGQPLRQWRSTSIASILPGAAQQVTLQRGDEPAVTAKRQDGRWMLTEPVSGRADRAAVEGLVNVIGGGVIDSFIADQPADLAPYGLAEPSRVLTVSAGEDQTHRLAVGAPVDLEQSKYFAMYNDVPVVFTLRKHDVERLDKAPNDLRDPRLASVSPADISEITLTRENQPNLHLVRDQGRWTFGEPAPGFTLEPQAVEQLLQAITAAKAADYLNIETARLMAPIATVTLGISTRSDPQVLTIHGSPTDAQLTVVHQGETTGYIVPRQNLQPLLEPVIAYRERTVLDIGQDQIAELHIRRSGPTAAEYHIVRSDGQWKLDGLEQAMVKRLLESLTPLRAESWITPGTSASGSEQVQLRIKLTNGGERLLSIGPVTRVATLEGVMEPFLVSEQLTDLLTGELRLRTVLPATIEGVRSVQVGQVMLERNAQGRFNSPQGAVDEQKVAAMWDALAGLQAEHFVDASRAAGEPTQTLTITTGEGPQTLRLWLPEDAGAPAVAQLNERTFTLDRPTAAALIANPLRPR